MLSLIGFASSIARTVPSQRTYSQRSHQPRDHTASCRDIAALPYESLTDPRGASPTHRAGRSSDVRRSARARREPSHDRRSRPTNEPRIRVDRGQDVARAGSAPLGDSRNPFGSIAAPVEILRWSQDPARQSSGCRRRRCRRRNGHPSVSTDRASFHSRVHHRPSVRGRYGWLESPGDECICRAKLLAIDHQPEPIEGLACCSKSYADGSTRRRSRTRQPAGCRRSRPGTSGEVGTQFNIAAATVIDVLDVRVPRPDGPGVKPGDERSKTRLWVEGEP